MKVSMNALLFAVVAGILTFIFDGQLSTLMITNILLGFIAGMMIDKRR